MNMMPQSPTQTGAETPAVAPLTALGHAPEATTASPAERAQGRPVPPAPAAAPPRRRRWLAGVALAAIALAGGGVLLADRFGILPGAGTASPSGRPAAAPATPPVTHGAAPAGTFRLSETEMRALRIEPVPLREFTTERVADGRIALNEDRATPILSPYNGRVVRVHARVGDEVKAGDTLFEIETTDLAGAANDLLAAVDGAGKARAALDQARREEARQNSLLSARAASQRDVEQARVAVTTGAADLRSAEATLAAARDKLRVLGRSAEQLHQIEETRRVDAVVPVTAPIGGTVTQRRVGPGQWLSTGAGGEPVFGIADLSTVWLVAAVRELDAPLMQAGQAAAVTVAALPERQFDARLATIGAGLDPVTRRLTVRAEVQDPERLLKPEMFATFRIAIGAPRRAVAVPVNAVIFRGADAYVWVAEEGNGFALRRIRPGVRAGDLLEVKEGLSAGERVVTGGALFIDRAARMD
jgi:cobalt-zinc-cadmium efflux system membrane fusion protein